MAKTMAPSVHASRRPTMAAADTALASRLQALAQNFAALTQRQKLALAAAAAVGFSLLVGVLLWSRQPDYAVLFSNLEERDGGAIVTALQQQNVPYKFSPGGAALLVPASQVHDVRLRLAAQGLPRGGLVGFELMENQKLGVSQFHEQVNFQRALEGELARTIQSIAAVASARVHLAIPKQSAFLRDEQQPTASVLVNLHSGRHLDASQVAGIVHLVAASVPNMANDKVSVVDQDGNLLTAAHSPLRAAGLDPTQLRYAQELEETYIKRIGAILGPLVGADNFKAQVTADVDFSQTEQTAETYRPNPDPEQQAVRNRQTGETPGRKPQSSPASRDTTTDYELDRTVQHTKLPMGTVKRLSVAVVVNQRSDAEPPLRQITELVREAVGFNAQRGDSLNVALSPFAVTPPEAPAELPLWKDPEARELGKEAAQALLVIAVLAFIAFGIVRPLLRKGLATAAPVAREPGREESAEGEEEGATLRLSPEAAAAGAFEARLARARDLARDDPRGVATLIKEWLGAAAEGRP